MDMSLVNIALGISTARFESQKSTAVAVKAVDVTKAQGEAAVEAIKQAADFGKAIQASASPPGIGENLDVPG